MIGVMHTQPYGNDASSGDFNAMTQLREALAFSIEADMDPNAVMYIVDEHGNLAEFTRSMQDAGGDGVEGQDPNASGGGC